MKTYKPKIVTYFKMLKDYHEASGGAITFPYFTLLKSMIINTWRLFVSSKFRKICKMYRSTEFYRKFVYPRIKRPYLESRERFIDWFFKNAGKLPGRKIYALRFSRDCDMYESTHRIAFKNWFSYQYSLIHLYDDAEGPQSLTIISKEEYDEFKSSHRDRIMEAYENGNGTSIYV